MTTVPKKMSMNVDIEATKRDSQATFVADLAERVRARAEALGFNARSFGLAVGVKTSSADNYWKGARPWPAEFLPALADVLNTNVDILVRGRRAGLLVNAADADWIEVPEYSLLEIDEHGKMEPVGTTLMRKDWLYTGLGETSGVWITLLPARFDDMPVGSPLFCKDHRPGERLVEGAHYLFRINGGIVMAPFTFRDSGAADNAVRVRDIGAEEEQYQVVARVIGQLARPL